MNKNSLLALALVLLAALSIALIASSLGSLLTGAVGKSVWYLPYAALVGAARFAHLAKAR